MLIVVQSQSHFEGLDNLPTVSPFWECVMKHQRLAFQHSSFCQEIFIYFRRWLNSPQGLPRWSWLWSAEMRPLAASPRDHYYKRWKGGKWREKTAVSPPPPPNEPWTPFLAMLWIFLFNRSIGLEILICLWTLKESKDTSLRSTCLVHFILVDASPILVCRGPGCSQPERKHHLIHWRLKVWSLHFMVRYKQYQWPDSSYKFCWKDLDLAWALCQLGTW